MKAKPFGKLLALALAIFIATLAATHAGDSAEPYTCDSGTTTYTTTIPGHCEYVAPTSQWNAP